MTLSKLDKEALSTILNIAMDNAVGAVFESNTIFGPIHLHNASVGLQDYMWNLRGRP